MLRKRGGVWHYDFVVRGERYRGSTHEKNERKAQAIESVERGKAITGTAPLKGKRPTLVEFSQRFFEWLAMAPLDEDTVKYYKHGWGLVKGTALANMRLDALQTDVIAAVRFPDSPANQNCALRTIRRMLGKAREWNVIGIAPRVKLVKEYGRDRLIDAEMERKLLEVAAQPLRDVLLIVLDAGMRPNEVFRLRWEHIDFASRTMFNPHGKTFKARRWVPMSLRIVDALKAREPKAEGWVFPSPRAKCGHLTTVAIQFREARQLAGLPKDVVLYCGRHTFGTEMLRRTGNLAAVMKVMGHSSTQTAMIYQHPELQQIREAVDARNEMSQTASQSSDAQENGPVNAEVSVVSENGTDWVN